MRIMGFAALTSAAAVLTGLVIAPAAATPATAAPAAARWTFIGADAVSSDNLVNRAGGTVLADPTHHPSSQREAGGYGVDVLPARTLPAPARSVLLAVDSTTAAGGSVTAELRGLQPSGQWTQWQPVTGGSTTFGTAVDQVQARVTLTTSRGSGPTLRSLRLTPLPAEAGTAGPGNAASPGVLTPMVAALTSTVYATREGLVGGTTANGHVITTEDHFVALPSRVALNAKGGTTYQVQVCRGTTCVTAPVWDIGPWNTRDDYWDAPRAEFNDLPRGTPEATAAYNSGYNGGHDDSGRSVLNPAGIDLADGVFHALGMTNNGNVTVTYLWTGTACCSVGGAIAAKYDSLGGAGGFLGAPTTNELTTPDSPWGVGKYNHFANDGSIYWTSTTGAFSVHGAIQDEWAAIGWEQKLGFPTTDETTTPDGIGRFNHFQIGSIYWTPATGAHEVQGVIQDKWASLGWERSALGYPTSDEAADPVGRRSNFQGGYIIYNAGTGVSTAYLNNGTVP